MPLTGEIFKTAAGILTKVGIAGTAFMVIYLFVCMLELADIKKTCRKFCSILIAVWLLIIACGVMLII